MKLCWVNGYEDIRWKEIINGNGLSDQIMDKIRVNGQLGLYEEHIVVVFRSIRSGWERFTGYMKQGYDLGIFAFV